MIRRTTRLARLLSVATGPLILCGCATRTVVFDTEASRRTAPRMCDAHLGAHGEARDLDVVIEPADTLRYAASGAKRVGILRVPERALHIELPKAARTEWREVYTAGPPTLLLHPAASRPRR